MRSINGDGWSGEKAMKGTVQGERRGKRERGLVGIRGDGCRGEEVVMGVIQGERWEWEVLCGLSQWRIYLHVKAGGR